jgi:hypothetical protein
MRLIANCQLTGDYGTVTAGDIFIVPDPDAQKLITAGVARRADPPRILYETKPARYEMRTIQPEAPEVSARSTFPDAPGYVRLPDAQPQTVASESDSVLPKPNVSEQGTPDP